MATGSAFWARSHSLIRKSVSFAMTGADGRPITSALFAGNRAGHTRLIFEALLISKFIEERQTTSTEPASELQGFGARASRIAFRACAARSPTIRAGPTNSTGEESATPPELVCRVASSQAERQAAFSLVYRAYLQAGLIELNPYEMRVTAYHLLTGTDVLPGLGGSSTDRHAEPRQRRNGRPGLCNAVSV